MDFINEILFWVCWFVLMWNGYFLLVNKGIPNIKTAPAIRKAIIAKMKSDMNGKQSDSPYTITDMGCGNGHFSREIAKAIPDATVIGIEISKLAYWHACLKQKLNRQKNLKFVNSDFYKTDISNSNALVMFLLGSLMGEIRTKLESDLAAGTLVCSNKFKVGGDWNISEEIDVETAWPNQKTFYVYHAPEKI